MKRKAKKKSRKPIVGLSSRQLDTANGGDTVRIPVTITHEI